MKMTAFLDISLYSLIEAYWWFRGAHSLPWWWRQQAPLKRLPTSMTLCSAISKKAAIFILAAVRTWNVTY
jgi:hypothetical protein